MLLYWAIFVCFTAVEFMRMMHFIPVKFTVNTDSSSAVYLLHLPFVFNHHLSQLCSFVLNATARKLFLWAFHKERNPPVPISLEPQNPISFNFFKTLRH